MKRILIAGAMILAFAGGSFANSGSTVNPQDEKTKESATVTGHTKYCSKEMSPISDDAPKQKK